MGKRNTLKTIENSAMTLGKIPLPRKSRKSKTKIVNKYPVLGKIWISE